MTEHKDPLEIIKYLVHAFYIDRDYEAVLRYYSKDYVSWIGIDQNAFANSYESLEYIFKTKLRDNLPCTIIEEKYGIMAQGDKYCIVAGRIELNFTNSKGTVLRQGLRGTFAMGKVDGGWKVFHQHMSVAVAAPWMTQQRKTMNPMSYEQLLRALDEKTEQVEMIARTTAGGMKGSVDDDKYTFFYVNDELCSMLGYTYEEFMEMSGGTAVGAVYPPDLPGALESVARWFEKGPEYKAEYRIRKKDGSLLWVLDSGRKVVNPKGETIINSIITDISEIKGTLNQLQIEKERNDIVAELSEDVIYDYDVKTDLLEVFKTHMSTGKRIRIRSENFLKDGGLEAAGFFAEDMPELLRLTENVLKNPHENDIITGEFRKKDDEKDNYSWRKLYARCVFDSDQNLARVVGKIVDISTEKQLIKKAKTDSLTGLLNRVCVEQEIDAYLKEMSDGVKGAFVLVDIDYFKRLNDTYGHLCGDSMLCELSRMLRSSCRITDVVGRLGGDEFVIFLKDIYDIAIVKERVELLRLSVRNYSSSQRLPLNLSLSIGIAVAENSTRDFRGLYHEADIALYCSKGKGRNCYTIYKEN